MTRWSIERAQAWWAELGWVCGFNYLPSSAVNFLEMWHPETFDRDTISRELVWAGEAGFNAVRINLHYLVWKHDADGLMERLRWFVRAAADRGLGVVICPFDDCGFGGFEPVYGAQPDPVPDVHNSRAVASPGRAALLDGSEWASFGAYVREVVGSFRDDPRVLFWDLYNEPGNRMMFSADGYGTYEPDFTPASLRLMRDSFRWARDEDPMQPLTVGAWVTPEPGSDADPYQTEADRIALELSDIITFHAYWDAPHVARFIDHLAQHDRPMLCTEWMARPIGSVIDDQLDLFRERGVGCFQWGLVQGRTQTNLPWPAELVRLHGGHADRSVWFHDLFDAEGTPYRPEEVAKIRQVAGR
ncbi:cellulase family glycosylhydrolase [Palleronia caenipelagi]|nr:cellulase family glycosylhydrolase [Palleronia caenipelagi]